MLLLFWVRVRDGSGILFRVLDTAVKTATRCDEKDAANSPTWSCEEERPSNLRGHALKKKPNGHFRLHFLKFPKKVYL